MHNITTSDHTVCTEERPEITVMAELAPNYLLYIGYRYDQWPHSLYTALLPVTTPSVYSITTSDHSLYRALLPVTTQSVYSITTSDHTVCIQHYYQWPHSL